MLYTVCIFLKMTLARRGGVEIAGWTLDRKIRFRFPAYPHRVWALWWHGGKDVFGRPGARVGVGSARKTPSCLWRGCPAAGQNLEFGHLSRHFIAEISLNVTLNHNQQQKQQNDIDLHLINYNLQKVSLRVLGIFAL